MTYNVFGGMLNLAQPQPHGSALWNSVVHSELVKHLPRQVERRHRLSTVNRRLSPADHTQPPYLYTAQWAIVSDARVRLV